MNKHLNYFQAYSHDFEDQLTRGFMLLLRISPSIFAFVYDYIKSKYDSLPENNNSYRMPSLFEADLSTISFDIQTSAIDNISVSFALSVLITDERLNANPELIRETRGARYDGLITIGDDLLIVIE